MRGAASPRAESSARATSFSASESWKIGASKPRLRKSSARPRYSSGFGPPMVPAPMKPISSTGRASAVEREGLRWSVAVGYPAFPADTQGREHAMAAKKKLKKTAAKKPAKRAATPAKAPVKKKASARSAGKASGREAKSEVVYTDVLSELRSSLVSRLIR